MDAGDGDVAAHAGHSVVAVVGARGFEPPASWSRSQRSVCPGDTILSQTVARGQQTGFNAVQGSRTSPVDTKTFVTHLLPGAQAARMSSASEPLMTIAAVSAWLNVSPATVYRLCASGKLPHIRVSNAIRIDPDAVAAYIEGRGGP